MSPQLHYVSKAVIFLPLKNKMLALKFRLANAYNWILQCVQSIICSCMIWLYCKGLNSADGWMLALGTLSQPACVSSWTRLVYECRRDHSFLFTVTPPPCLEPQIHFAVWRTGTQSMSNIDRKSSWFNPRTVLLPAWENQLMHLLRLSLMMLMVIIVLLCFF